MDSTFNIDTKLYESVLDLLNDLHITESKGNITDFRFYFDDLWLSDTAVIENLAYVSGQWDVELLFALHTNPLRFIKRQITSYSCLKKATLTASLMRRLAAKDQRGTLTVDLKDLSICCN